MIPRRIIVVSLAVATSLLGDSTMYIVLPTYAERLGIRLALVGVLLSANRFVRLFSNSWSGRIHDRSHTPWPFVIALVVGACLTAVYGLLWGFWIFLTARLLWGVCWSFLRLEGYASVITESPPSSRGKLMGVYKSIIGAGWMAGGFLGGVLTDTIGYRNCLLLFACLSLLAAFALFLEQWRGKSSQYRMAGGEDTSPTQTDSQIAPDEPRGDGSSGKWALYFMGFINILVSGGIISSTLGRLLMIRFGTTISFGRTSVGIASATGTLALIRRTASLLLAPVFGHLTDRVGRRSILMAGFAISSLALLGMITQRHFILISLVAVIGSISGTAVSVSLDASIVDIATQRRRGQTVSRYVTFTDLGSACGPLISYLLMDAHVSIESVYLGGLALLIIACAFCGLRTVGKKDDAHAGIG